MRTYFKNLIRRFIDNLIGYITNIGEIRRRLDIGIDAYWNEKRRHAKNPFIRFGEKYFSQNDEDGIILEITKRMDLKNGVFVEFGCGNGLENNSIILLFRGWRGVWIGNVDLAIQISSTERLNFIKAWVLIENCVGLLTEGLQQISAASMNVLSIDLDGNDYYFLAELLARGCNPDLIIVEYNGKFPPPISFVVPYCAERQWDLTDNFGASIQAFCDLMQPYQYSLVCCNLTGTNAFFVKSSYLHLFPEIPRDIGDIFVPADYNWFFRRGHKVSPATIERAFLQGK